MGRRRRRGRVLRASVRAPWPAEDLRPGAGAAGRGGGPLTPRRSPIPAVTFYFDIGSPYAYLTGERLPAVLPEPVDWQPVLLGGLFQLAGRGSWAVGDRERRRRGMAEIERRARSYGLPPLRWPDPWPTDYLVAMRATTFACSIGRGREFALAAWRSAFQHGVELSVPDRVFDLAPAIGQTRETLATWCGDPEIKRALRDATVAAHAAGVFGVPTIAVGEELFWGDDRLQDAAAGVERAGRLAS